MKGGQILPLRVGGSRIADIGVSGVGLRPRTALMNITDVVYEVGMGKGGDEVIMRKIQLKDYSQQIQTLYFVRALTL